jgi:hypothetical protein
MPDDFTHLREGLNMNLYVSDAIHKKEFIAFESTSKCVKNLPSASLAYVIDPIYEELR